MPGSAATPRVSLLPSATELVFALGAQTSLVGASHECDLPPGTAAPDVALLEPCGPSLSRTWEELPLILRNSPWGPPELRRGYRDAAVQEGFDGSIRPVNGLA